MGTSPWKIGVVAALLVCGCGERGFEMTLESTDGTRAQSGSRAYWSLWGVDETIADNIGTELAHGSHEVEGFPETFWIEVPRYPHDRVAGGIHKEDGAYWFSVWIDLDGDEEFCGGVDMFEAWEDFNDAFMHDELPRRRTIPMALLANDHPCMGVAD